jgi:hypothetical protein
VRGVRDRPRLNRPAPRAVGRRRGLIAALFAIVLAAAAIPLLLREPAERAAGPAPEAVAPYGIVSRGGLSFRWAIPSDGAPVRVEVFDSRHAPIWKSGPSTDGSLRPPKGIVEAWPLEDLLWMPVAVPGGGPERPGDLAAFTLAP